MLSCTLTSLYKQSELNEIEVIVIDNGSSDNTLQIVEGFKDKIPNLKYEFNDMPGLLTGRHRGVELASAEILCFLDDDVILNAYYINTLKNLFDENEDLHFATGPCLPDFEKAPPYWLAYFWDKFNDGKFCFWLSLLDLGNKPIKISPIFVCGLNFCCRKATLIRLEGFHPDCIPASLQQFQGDGETALTQKAIAQNLEAFYHPGLLVKHIIPNERLTFEYFKKRAYYQGVCNSFSISRASVYKDNALAPTAIKPLSLIKRINNKAQRIYFKFWPKNQQSEKPEEIKRMFEELAESEKQGFMFHQNAFNTDPNVKNWVLKKNYWNYTLPIQ
ncbi:hypothetical protein DF947_13940 [Pedobacter paludis]|uniref:Glycosyltransferase 2-like domain-containing protein n=2 Tax=Pedobacter paludis TaxID=2203212 RepID=A0A317EZ05_9SPHI|nr:hypothetical protein DF947_13940 [Pedobacter paludis]